MKRYGHLIAEIIADGNMQDAFDEVVGGLKKERRAYYEAKKSRVIADLQASIGAGVFRVRGYTEFEVTDGPKRRTVQSPCVTDRIGCNAIMKIVEKYVYPSVIRTSAASIKGRGMHRLYRKVRTDIRHDREGTRYYYKCDIRKFYQSIDQGVMWQCITTYIKDPILLPILKNFVELMPSGLSIGLRSSQCFGNILLSRIDHRMKSPTPIPSPIGRGKAPTKGCRYYYRYCDDIVVLAGSKEELWYWRDVIHEEAGRLGLEIKPDEAVRPISEGLDFLGYVDDGTHSRLRKRTKQNAARKLHRVKSRRRRQEITGSLKGMAKWGDCGNLYKRLTGRSINRRRKATAYTTNSRCRATAYRTANMGSFKELGLQYVAEDGKKRFSGKQVTLRSLMNVHITILDFEKDIKTENGLRTVVSFAYDDGSQGKYFTADKQQLWYLEKAQEIGGLPFDTTIGSEVFGNGKVRYIFT